MLLGAFVILPDLVALDSLEVLHDELVEQLQFRLDGSGCCCYRCEALVDVKTVGGVTCQLLLLLLGYSP